MGAGRRQSDRRCEINGRIMDEALCSARQVCRDGQYLLLHDDRLGRRDAFRQCGAAAIRIVGDDAVDAGFDDERSRSSISFTVQG